MNNHAIAVRQVSKTFRIYQRPSDRVREVFSFFSRKRYSTEFQALREVSFSVHRGEFVGIVGKNGAGKSTLLRILAGELTPTHGEIEINGSVSLLQLGLGFNPELTGIENAEFACRLMEMEPTQITDTLNRISAFADIGEFMDRPIKTYSSGMHSRLSFAIAINVDPDILIVDEVLAVGDMRFTQKCLRKMREFKDNGKTVVLVTHDLESVNAFCDSVIWIKDGRVHMQGETNTVTEQYRNFMLYDQITGIEVPEYKENKTTVSTNDRWVPISTDTHQVIGNGGVRPVAAQFSHEAKTLAIKAEERCSIAIKFVCERIQDGFDIGWVIHNRLGQVILHMNNEISGVILKDLPLHQECVIHFDFTWPGLAPGTYSLTMGAQSTIDDKPMLWRAHDVIQIESAKSNEFGDQCGVVTIPPPKIRIT